MTLHSPLADDNAATAVPFGAAAPRTTLSEAPTPPQTESPETEAPVETSVEAPDAQEERPEVETSAETSVEPETAPEETVAEETVAEAPVEAPAEAPEAQEELSGFAQFDLPESIMEAITASGYTEPTPIQEAMIPHVLEGKDVLGQAQTGTGKTAAFALPLLAGLNTHLRHPQILVLAPTRELAIQVSEAFSTYGKSMKGLRMATLYGGQGYESQLRQLRKGAQIIVGTPGRVMDHMRKGSLDVDELQTLVLDEADEMLRMGFIEDVEWVLDQIPDERQLALFSATMPSAIHRLARKYLENPVEIKIAAKQLTADTVRQRWWLVRGFDKRTALVRLLEGEDTDGVLVFVRTKADTVKVADFLSSKGFQCSPLNGDMQQNQREHTVDRLKRGRVDIVVATDVAARGLDVERISHVINYDIPFDRESYVHRIGRTGRAGRQGDAVLFVNRGEMHLLRNLQRHAGTEFEPLELPDAEAINRQRVVRFEQKITRTLEKDIDFYKYMVMEYVRENEVELEDVAGALAMMAQGGTKLLLPPDPPELSESVEKALAKKGRRKDRKNRERGERPDKESLDKGLVTYRIEVGRRHGANPSQIVGAIANEAQIHSRRIGRIKIFTDFSLVDLPAAQEGDLMKSLAKTQVSGQYLHLQRDTGGSNGGYAEKKPRRSKVPPLSKRGYDGYSKKRGGKKGKKPRRNKF